MRTELTKAITFCLNNRNVPCILHHTVHLIQKYYNTVKETMNAVFSGMDHQYNTVPVLQDGSAKSHL